MCRTLVLVADGVVVAGDDGEEVHESPFQELESMSVFDSFLKLHPMNRFLYKMLMLDDKKKPSFRPKHKIKMNKVMIWSPT